MEQTMHKRQSCIIQHLSRLPRMMTQVHGRENVSEFILHELCSENCFNLRRAAFFIDNPDFNCLRGVAGFHQEDTYRKNANIWDNPEHFSNHMKLSPFNGKVRSIIHPSTVHNSDTTHSVQLNEVAETLDLTYGAHCSWRMRHDNLGILMYEKNDPQDTLIDEHLLDGISLLSFCPIF